MNPKFNTEFKNNKLNKTNSKGGPNMNSEFNINKLNEKETKSTNLKGDSNMNSKFNINKLNESTTSKGDLNMNTKFNINKLNESTNLKGGVNMNTINITNNIGDKTMINTGIVNNTNINKGVKTMNNTNIVNNVNINKGDKTMINTSTTNSININKGDETMINTGIVNNTNINKGVKTMNNTSTTNSININKGNETMINTSITNNININKGDETMINTSIANNTEFVYLTSTPGRGKTTRQIPYHIKQNCGPSGTASIIIFITKEAPINALAEKKNFYLHIRKINKQVVSEWGVGDNKNTAKEIEVAITLANMQKGKKGIEAYNKIINNWFTVEFNFDSPIPATNADLLESRGIRGAITEIAKTYQNIIENSQDEIVGPTEILAFASNSVFDGIELSCAKAFRAFLDSALSSVRHLEDVGHYLKLADLKVVFPVIVSESAFKKYSKSLIVDTVKKVKSMFETVGIPTSKLIIVADDPHGDLQLAEISDSLFSNGITVLSEKERRLFDKVFTELTNEVETVASELRSFCRGFVKESGKAEDGVRWYISDIYRGDENVCYYAKSMPKAHANVLYSIARELSEDPCKVKIWNVVAYFLYGDSNISQFELKENREKYKELSTAKIRKEVAKRLYSDHDVECECESCAMYVNDAEDAYWWFKLEDVKWGNADIKREISEHYSNPVKALKRFIEKRVGIEVNNGVVKEEFSRILKSDEIAKEQVFYNIKKSVKSASAFIDSESDVKRIKEKISEAKKGLVFANTKKSYFIYSGIETSVTNLVKRVEMDTVCIVAASHYYTNPTVRLEAANLVTGGLGNVKIVEESSELDGITPVGQIITAEWLPNGKRDAENILTNTPETVVNEIIKHLYACGNWKGFSEFLSSSAFLVNKKAKNIFVDWCEHGGPVKKVAVEKSREEKLSSGGFEGELNFYSIFGLLFNSRITEAGKRLYREFIENHGDCIECDDTMCPEHCMSIDCGNCAQAFLFFVNHKYNSGDLEAGRVLEAVASALIIAKNKFRILYDVYSEVVDIKRSTKFYVPNPKRKSNRATDFYLLGERLSSIALARALVCDKIEAVYVSQTGSNSFVNRDKVFVFGGTRTRLGHQKNVNKIVGEEVYEFEHFLQGLMRCSPRAWKDVTVYVNKRNYHYSHCIAALKSRGYNVLVKNGSKVEPISSAKFVKDAAYVGALFEDLGDFEMTVHRSIIGKLSKTKVYTETSPFEFGNLIRECAEVNAEIREENAVVGLDELKRKHLVNVKISDGKYVSVIAIDIDASNIPWHQMVYLANHLSELLDCEVAVEKSCSWNTEPAKKRKHPPLKYHIFIPLEKAVRIEVVRDEILPCLTNLVETIAKPRIVCINSDYLNSKKEGRNISTEALAYQLAASKLCGDGYWLVYDRSQVTRNKRFVVTHHRDGIHVAGSGAFTIENAKKLILLAQKDFLATETVESVIEKADKKVKKAGKVAKKVFDCANFVGRVCAVAEKIIRGEKLDLRREFGERYYENLSDEILDAVGEFVEKNTKLFSKRIPAGGFNEVITKGYRWKELCKFIEDGLFANGNLSEREKEFVIATAIAIFTYIQSNGDWNKVEDRVGRAARAIGYWGIKNNKAKPPDPPPK